MRIPGHKIYRAFRELDPFTDEQCIRFVRAARGSKWRRLRTALLVVLAWVLTLAAVWFAGYQIQRSWPSHLAVRLMLGPRGETLRDFVLLLGGLGLPTLASALTRDFRLRRRVRRVINTRGSCPACGYGLTGLNVSEALEVLCPECAYVLIADAQLGEVAPDSSGVRRYLPSPDRVQGARWLTPRRRKWVLRIIIGGPIAAVLFGGGFWLLYERFLQAQAVRAQAQRPTPATIEARLAPYLGGKPGDPNAWELFGELIRQKDKSDAVWRSNATNGPSRLYPEFTSIAEFFPSRMTPEIAAATGLGLKMLGVYESDGVFTIMDRMSGTPYAQRPVAWPTARVALANVFQADLSSIRQLARINAGRMRLAFQERDLKRFESSVEAGFATSRMLRTSPLLIDWLTADAILALHNRTIAEVLSRRPDPEWVKSILDARDRQRSPTPRFVLADLHRDLSLDHVGWFYADPTHVRFGVLAPHRPGSLLSVSPKHNPFRERLGSFDESNTYVEESWKLLRRAYETRPFERERLTWPAPPGLVAAQLLGGPQENLVRGVDVALLREDQISVLCALELYRAAHGEYPATLSDLVPELLSSLPPDPWTGKPFGYRRLQPGPSGLPRFLLYSAGSDGEDNGGEFSENSDSFRAIYGDMYGFDARLNFDSEAKYGTDVP